MSDDVQALVHIERNPLEGLLIALLCPAYELRIHNLGALHTPRVAALLQGMSRCKGKRFKDIMRNKDDCLVKLFF